MINYNIAYSKTAYKFQLKTFYNRTNKKKYDLQIRKYNVYYTNRIIIKNLIITKKAGEKKKLSKDIVNITVLAEVPQALNLNNLAKRNIWTMSNTDLNGAKK